MPDVAGNSSLDARWRPWHALALLLAAYAAFNLFLTPMAATPADEFPALLWIGVTFVQPVLFAIWTSIGPAPATKRVPLSIAVFVLLLFAGCIPARDQPSLEDEVFALVVMPFFLFLLALAVMFVVRIATRWSIENTRDTESHASPVNQFSIKYLLVITAICAVLLGIGRGLATSLDWSNNPAWHEFGSFIAHIGIILLAVTPAIVIPITVLLTRPTIRMFVVTIISAAVLAWIAIEAIILVDNPPRNDVSRQVALVELGAVLASIASALLLRIAGYRLVRKSRASSFSTTV